MADITERLRAIAEGRQILAGGGIMMPAADEIERLRVDNAPPAPGACDAVGGRRRPNRRPVRRRRDGKLP